MPATSEFDNARRYAAHWRALAAAAPDEPSRQQALVNAAGWEQRAAQLQAKFQAPTLHAPPGTTHGPHGAAPQPQFVAAPQPVAAPQHVAAPRGSTVWTLGTTFVLVGTLLAVIGVGVGGTFFYNARNEAARIPPGPSVESVAGDFLDGVIARDPDARELLAPRVAAAEGRLASEWGSRDGALELVVGDPAVAELLGLEVEYEVLDVRYDQGDWGDTAGVDTANTAGALVRLHYAYEASGERIEASSLQELRFERAFYFASREGPVFSYQRDEYEFPAAVSPWRVTGFADRYGFDPPDDAGPFIETNLVVAADDEAVTPCNDGRAIIVRMSTVLRVDGYLEGDCMLDVAKFEGLGEGVTFEALEGLPPITEATDVPELTGLEAVGAVGRVLESNAPPISQHLVVIGGEQYVFVSVAAMSRANPGQIETRLLRVEKRSR